MLASAAAVGAPRCPADGVLRPAGDRPGERPYCLGNTESTLGDATLLDPAPLPLPPLLLLLLLLTASLLPLLLGFPEPPLLPPVRETLESPVELLDGATVAAVDKPSVTAESVVARLARPERRRAGFAPAAKPKPEDPEGTAGFIGAACALDSPSDGGTTVFGVTVAVEPLGGDATIFCTI